MVVVHARVGIADGMRLCAWRPCNPIGYGLVLARTVGDRSARSSGHSPPIALVAHHSSEANTLGVRTVSRGGLTFVFRREPGGSLSYVPQCMQHSLWPTCEIRRALGTDLVRVDLPMTGVRWEPRCLRVRQDSASATLHVSGFKTPLLCGATNARFLAAAWRRSGLASPACWGSSQRTHARQLRLSYPLFSASRCKGEFVPWCCLSPVSDRPGRGVVRPAAHI